MRNFLELIRENLGDVREIMPWDLSARLRSNPDLLIIDLRDPRLHDAQGVKLDDIHQALPKLARVIYLVEDNQLVERLVDHGEARTGLCAVEPHHDIALLDLIAFLDQQLAHDTPCRVLDLLDVAVDHQLARRDHRPRDLRRGGPATDPDHEKSDGCETQDQGLARRMLNARQHGHDGVLPGTRSGCGVAP